MEEHLLISFITLADELHYKRAAERLFISQPALSKRIALLERNLSAQLFIRHNRKVQLTDSGKYFVGQAKMLLEKFLQVKTQIHHIDNGSEGEVRVGFVGSAMQRLIPKLIMTSNASYPNIGFSLEEMSIINQVDALLNDTIDIGIVLLKEIPKELEILPVHEENFALALPKDHPLGQDNFEHLSQLAEESFILFSSSYSKYYYDKINSIFEDAGFQPIVKNKSINAGIIFQLVSNGYGLAVVPKSLALDFNLPVKLIELKDIPQKAVLSVLWHRNNISKPFRKVLDLIQSNWSIGK